VSVKGCRYWQRIRNSCSEVGVALGGHSDTSWNTRRLVITYDVSHRQVVLSDVPFEVLTAVLLKIRSFGLLHYAVVPDVSNTIVFPSSGRGSLQRNLRGLLDAEDERTTFRRNASITCPSTPLHNAEEMNLHRFLPEIYIRYWYLYIC
jgi:hypothetical protein